MVKEEKFMPPVTLEFLKEQLELADELLAGRAHMNRPQDLPGRYGRVIQAIDHVLQAMNGEAVLCGGWAVWHHGFVGRITQDVDIALPADQVDEFMRMASVAGFEVLPLQPGRWPKLQHKQTQVKVDILPEGARPGTANKLAPTTIPHPGKMGASTGSLTYMSFLSLIELKLAAGRLRDESDVGELVRANPDKVDAIRQHLASVHPDYLTHFNELVKRAQMQTDQ
jgi:hypothetical protein